MLKQLKLGKKVRTCLLDDVSVAASLLDCTFESESLCTYSTNVGYNWTVVQADSATDGLVPGHDHTTRLTKGPLTYSFLPRLHVHYLIDNIDVCACFPPR